MPTVKDWFVAFRLRTLPLAFASIIMAACLALQLGFFDWSIFLLSLVTTLFLQVLSNLANDYGDAVSGVDGSYRQGPQRQVQQGVITKRQMKKALWICSALAFMSGLALLYVAFQTYLIFFLIYLGIGILAIVAAITYTVGKRPYGYVGLGDISVLIFFGFVGVGAAFFLYSKIWYWQVLLPAMSCGALATGVLNVNNMRDLVSDQQAGKRSVPVMIGLKAAKVYHTALIAVWLVLMLIYQLLFSDGVYSYLFFLVLPLLTKHLFSIWKRNGPALDPLLKQLALSSLLFVLLFLIGSIIDLYFN